MSETPGNRWQRVACVWAAACIAGCAAPPARYKPLTLSPAVTPNSVASQAPSPPLPARSPPSSMVPSAARPGRIRLAAHESESEPQSPIDGRAADDSATSETVKPAAAEITSPAPHPIDLGTVLQLTDGQNPQVAFARERIQEAFAQLDRAHALWLPSTRLGVTYDKHDGSTQLVDGTVFPSSRTAFFSGFGGVLPGAATPAIPGLFANFTIADALFQPRIAQQTAASRQSAATATRNDALLDSALAYLELLRAEQDVAIAREARGNTQQLVDLTGIYAETGKGTQADHDRAMAELAVRKTDVLRSEEAV